MVDQSSKEAYEEMCQLMRNENEQFYAQFLVNSKQVIDSYTKLGESGGVFLTFMALRIAAMVEAGELP